MLRLVSICILCFAGFWAVPISAQPASGDTTFRVADTPDRVCMHLGRATVDLGSAGLFLFGAFCSLWAQNTGRNAWLWFFLGFLFSVITIFFLLTKNANDLQARKIRERVRRE